MRLALIDTDILSLFLRGNNNVRNKCAQYIKKYNNLNFSIMTYYEILSGLKHKDAKKQLDVFLQFSAINNILPLTLESCKISANIYADLRKKGTPVDDIDLLIAGISIENNMDIITNNTKHFDRITGLDIYNWTE